MEEEIEKTEVVETAVRAAEEAAEALGEKTLEELAEENRRL